MLGAIIAGIAGAVGSIATAAVSVVKSLAVVGMAVEGLKSIGKVLVNLAKSLGLIKPQMQVDELGDKAIQSGYDPGQYDTYNDYVKAVENFNLDPEKSKTISEEEKIKKGMELATGVMIEKYKDSPMEKFCVEIGNRPDFFNEGVLKGVGELVVSDENAISDFTSFLDGTLKNDDKLEDISGKLADLYKAGNPGVSDGEALDAVFGARK